jgi:hypothetical protein
MKQEKPSSSRVEFQEAKEIQSNFASFVSPWTKPANANLHRRHSVSDASLQFAGLLKPSIPLSLPAAIPGSCLETHMLKPMRWRRLVECPKVLWAYFCQALATYQQMKSLHMQTYTPRWSHALFVPRVLHPVLMPSLRPISDVVSSVLESQTISSCARAPKSSKMQASMLSG